MLKYVAEWEYAFICNHALMRKSQSLERKYLLSFRSFAICFAMSDHLVVLAECRQHISIFSRFLFSFRVFFSHN